MILRRFTPLLVLASLAACGGGQGTSVKEIFGIDRSGPDAFNVVSRPALSVPPEFTLRAPAPLGTPGPGDPSATGAARTIITGEDAVPTAVTGVKSNGLASVSDQRFLERLGTTRADGNIREELSKDGYSQPSEDDDSWIDSIIPGSKKKTTLDPIDEAARLRSSEQKDAVQAPPAELLKNAKKPGNLLGDPGKADGK